MYIYVCNPPPSTSHPLPISLKCIYFNAGTETRYSNNNLNSNISEQICRFIIRSRVFGGFSFILDKHGDVSWIQGGTGSRSQQKNNQAPDFVDYTPSFNKIETYAMIRKQMKKDSITCFINFFVSYRHYIFQYQCAYFAPFNNLQIFISKHNIFDKLDI